MEQLTLQIFDCETASWHDAVTLTFARPEQGIQSPVFVAYCHDWVDLLWSRTSKPFPANCQVSLLLDADFGEARTFPSWPPFLLDLLPQGAARSYWSRLSGLSDALINDLSFLKMGSFNVPGNLRVKYENVWAQKYAFLKDMEDVFLRNADWHLKIEPPQNGFLWEEVLTAKWDFLEYARRLGAPISGATGAQGMAPKFLLRMDGNHRLHADMELPDAATAKCILVKFPRPGIEIDELIIIAERAYLKVAQEMSFYVQELQEKSEALVVRRFDYTFGKKRILKLGLESMASVCGSSIFGENIRLEKQCAAILKFSTDPFQNLVEFLARDALNIALKNTDNHARNTAFLKHNDGTVELSPLFDLAPMYLDPSGIARVSAFGSEFRAGGFQKFPNYFEEFDKAISFIPKLKKKRDKEIRSAKENLRERLAKFKSLAHIMENKGVPERICTDLEQNLQEFSKWIEEIL